MLTTTQGVIAADLDAFEQTSWFTSAYLVAMSSVAPLSGRLSQIFSPSYCIFVSTIITAIGLLITASAPTLATFLVGRAVTGAGAAGLFTVSIILVVQLTTPKRRGLFNGLLNACYTTGVGMGAVLAGAIEPALGWRALFWLQAPVALIAGSVLVVAIPSSLFATSAKSHDDTKKASVLTKLAHIDYLGAALLVSSIVLVLYGLSTPTISATPIVIFAILFPLFLYRETYQAADPIIPLSVLSSRGALLSCFATLGFMMARWTVLFYTPIYAIAIRGWAPAKAGSILIPTNLGFAIGGVVPGVLHIRRGGSFWASCVVVFALFPLSLAALASASIAESQTWLYIFLTFCNGLCAGAALNYTLAHILHLVLPETRYVVTSLLATFRGFAGTFGSAVGGGIFTRTLQGSLENGFKRAGIKGREDLIHQLLGSPRVVQGLAGVERQIAAQGYVDALKALFFSAVGLACVALVLQAGTGWNAPADGAGEEPVDDSSTAVESDLDGANGHKQPRNGTIDRRDGASHSEA